MIYGYNFKRLCFYIVKLLFAGGIPNFLIFDPKQCGYPQCMF